MSAVPPGRWKQMALVNTEDLWSGTAMIFSELTTGCWCDKRWAGLVLQPLFPGPKFFLNGLWFPLCCWGSPRKPYGLQHCPQVDFYSFVNCIRSPLTSQHVIVLAFCGSPWALGNMPELFFFFCAHVLQLWAPSTLLWRDLQSLLPTISASKKEAPGFLGILFCFVLFCFQVLKRLFFFWWKQLQDESPFVWISRCSLFYAHPSLQLW